MPDNTNISVCAIAALAKGPNSHRVIGKNDDIPWEPPRKDMQRFVQSTKGKPVIMGRITWESFDDAYQPLPDRPNIVVTSQNEYEAPEAFIANSPPEALKQAQDTARSEGVDEVFVIGGQSIYEHLLPMTDKLLLTLIDTKITVSGDEDLTRFPHYEKRFPNKTIEAEHNEHDPPFVFIQRTR